MSHLHTGPQPRAVFQGHWMAPGSPGGIPVWLAVDDGHGGQVRRHGYGLLLGLGFALGLLAVVVVTVITLAVIA